MVVLNDVGLIEKDISRIIVADLLDLDFGFNQMLDIAPLLFLLIIDERKGETIGASSSGSAYSVNIVFWVKRKVKVKNGW